MSATAQIVRTTPSAEREIKKSSLSSSRQRLLTLLQAINFGRIERLVVREGEPVLDPMPQCIRTVKFGGDYGSRPEADREDFVLKGQHIALLRLLDDIGDGTIQQLTCMNGLPIAAEHTA